MKKIVKSFLIVLVAALAVMAFSEKNVTFAAEARKIDVWDFGGLLEEDTEKYNNNISSKTWDEYENLGVDGVFTITEIIHFGDLRLIHAAGDRVYSKLATKNYGTISYMNKRYADTYRAKGLYYCGEKDTVSKSNFMISNVEAGDKIVLYMGATDSGSGTVAFDYLDREGIQLDSKEFSDFKKIVFTAKYNGRYKIYTGETALAGYNRIVRIPGAKVSGVLDGCPTDVSGARLFFTNTTTGEEIDAKIENGRYSISLATGYEYEATLKGLFGYELSKNSIELLEGDVSAEFDLKVNKINLVYYDVKGGFLNGEASRITAIEFVDVDEGYTYAGTITSDGFEVKLIDGAYKVNITSDTYKTSAHIVVDGQNLEKDLMVSMINEEKITLERVDKIYVGYKDKTPNYDTVREAVAAAAAMNPTSEEERIVISIAPGTYREQIVINTPYLTLTNETDKDVLLTWYYGIGYMYYSAGEDGFYDEEKAYDKFEKREVKNWGCTVKINSSAKDFRAENIIFESSFNRYVTEEEIEDGVEVSGGTAITFNRKPNSIVTSKNATERATAAYVNADKSEFVNCSFLSSQDTLYTGNVSAYFKSCFIEGNTDFIFGDGNVVFDACEISLYGYSSGETAGYITAASTNLSNNGYLFRNCVVTADSLKIKNGYAFGRPWRANAKVVFENTKLNSLSYISAAGWKSMSDNSPENARFGEYNTTDLAGNAADVSGRVAGTVHETMTDFNYEDFLGYMPVYAVATDNTVEFAMAPGIVNTHGEGEYQPGHMLKAEYSLGAANDANDCSIVEWYRVLDGAETLIKASSVIADDTYTLTSDDSGAYIKIIVRPENVDGIKGAEGTYTTSEAVSNEVYVEPLETSLETSLETLTDVSSEDVSSAEASSEAESTEQVTTQEPTTPEPTTTSEPVTTPVDSDEAESSGIDTDNAINGKLVTGIIAIVAVVIVVIAAIALKKKKK